jgi:hypothetical protein
MCMFCAAIPATLAVGARLNAREKDSQKTDERQDQPVQTRRTWSSP